MNEEIQNAIVGRANPSRKSVVSGFLRSARQLLSRLPPAWRRARNAADSGSFAQSSGTRISAGTVPATNIAGQPNGAMSRMPSRAVSTAPTW